MGFGSFDTTLRFDGDREYDVEMTTVSLAAGWSLDERRTVRAAVGAILDGTLRRDGQRAHDGDSGALAAVGLEYRARAGAGKQPSIDLSGYFGMSWAQTTAPDSGVETDYLATDLRLGAAAGWSLRERTYSYVSARVFGGPVSWEIDAEDVTGNDVHHYQLGVGSAAELGPVSVFAEYFGLGETALAFGVSAAW